MRIETAYISSNCNHTPAAVHWGKNNLICYASCNAVFIWDPKYAAGGKVTRTLCGHAKRVNSVRWITNSEKECENELVSASADGNAIVWSLNENIDDFKAFVLKGHESNVNVVDGVYRDAKTGEVVIFTAAADSTIKIWHRSSYEDDFLLIQSVNLGYNICLSLRIAFFPRTSKFILAASMDDCKIKLFVEEINSNLAFEVFSLKGHDDWVRGLDFATDAKGQLLLASSSQDTFIRLWQFSATLNNDFDFEIDNKKCKITLESVLAGHEGWVYSTSWSPTGLQLLSASLDKTMIIWEYDSLISLWQEKVRVGEVGGNTLGFYGALFGPDGKSILGHSYHGSFHIWRCEDDGNVWKPEVTVGGHFSEVTDLGWEPGGEFLVTVSNDQTTRIHAPWKKREGNMVTWHEIGRPQVHGYDLSSLAVISRYSFASGAEEKVIRTFRAPKNFIDNFHRICRINNYNNSSEQFEPRGASVPSLGLSNKAVYSDTNSGDVVKSNKDQYLEESHFVAVDLTEPPTEETLVQNTLWPEVQKLYGHGYEVYSLAASPDCQLLASACKATSLEHAAIIIWEISTWKQIQKLQSHTLTVVQMSFSPDSIKLLSVSRDRRWSVFVRDITTNNFTLVATTDKKTSIHTRIIWCCSWTHDSEYFATGSRDGKVAFWAKGEENLGGYKMVSNFELKSESVTALAFAPGCFSQNYLVAVGLESGVILLYKWTIGCTELVLKLNKNMGHHMTVNKLAFRPTFGIARTKKTSENELQLASCGADHSVRVFNLFLGQL